MDTVKLVILPTLVVSFLSLFRSLSLFFFFFSFLSFPLPSFLSGGIQGLNIDSVFFSYLV